LTVREFIVKHSLLVLIATLISLSAAAELYENEQVLALYEKEASGVRAYLDGRYESAFGILSDTARRGMKESQYLLSLMFMKGEGIGKSVPIGIGWLGVAIESGDEEWNLTFKKIYDSLNDAQRAIIDDKVEDYVAKYGSAAQGVSCAERTVAGSRRVELRCDKAVGNYPLHEIETNL
jgi:TPR repeat protein